MFHASRFTSSASFMGTYSKRSPQYELVSIVIMARARDAIARSELGLEVRAKLILTDETVEKSNLS